MRWTVSYENSLQAMAFLAFLLGAVSANLAIQFSKEREKLCLNTSAEKLMDHFLLGVSYFSLAFNVSGFVLTILGVIPALAVLRKLKPVLWILKDVLLGLLITAAVVTLLSTLDIRSESACEFSATGKAVVSMASLSLIFALLYVLFRIFMTLARA